jgi:hypothetical protein
MNDPLDPWQGGCHTEVRSVLTLSGGRGSNENLQNSLVLQSTGRLRFIIDCAMKLLFSKRRMVSNDKSFDRAQQFVKQWSADGKHRIPRGLNKNIVWSPVTAHPREK